MQYFSFINVYGTTDLIYKVPVVSFNVENNLPEEVCVFLEKNYNIIVRSGLHCSPLIHKTINTLPTGTLRVSLGPYNSFNDVKTLIKALHKFGKVNKLF